MKNRAQSYRDRCKKEKSPDRIRPWGVANRIGRLNYTDEGVLYIGRKKVGPYMVQEYFGGVELVLRHGEQKNLHRIEQVRWNLLLHMQNLWARVHTTTARMKKVAVRKKMYGLYKDKWRQITFSRDNEIDVKDIEINEDNILDSIVNLSRSEEDHQLVATYLRTKDLLDKYWKTTGNINFILQHMFEDVRGKKDFSNRSAPFCVVINGRTYIVAHGHYPSPSHNDLGWPNPTHEIFNLDEARYGAPAEVL